MWRLKDELNDVQTLGAKCLKAARLRKIQRQSDFELPSVEVESLIALSNADYNCYGRLELTVNVHQFNQFNLSDTVKHSRFAYKTTHKSSLLHTVKSSRRKAEYIKNEMEYISTPYEKENYLMKQFIVYNFTGHQRSIARRYFLGSQQSAKHSQFREALRYLSVLILLPGVFAVMIYFTYQYNRGIGTRAMDLWLLVTFLSLVEDVFVLQPLKIWLTWIVLNSYVSSEAYKMCVALKLRFKSIMNRKHGVMRDTHALIQHFNPACRAARLFPELPVSRLLLALNDYDVPHFAVEKTHGLSVLEWGAYLSRRAVAFLTLFPSALQDVGVDITGILFINCLAIAFYLLGLVIAAVAIVLALVLLIVLFLRETTYIESMKKRKTMKSIAKYLPTLKKPVSRTNREAFKFEEMNNDFDSRVLYKSQFTPVKDDAYLKKNGFSQSNQRLIKEIRVKQNKRVAPNALALQPPPPPLPPASHSSPSKNNNTPLALTNGSPPKGEQSASSPSPGKRGSHGKVPRIDTRRLLTGGIADLSLAESKEGGGEEGEGGGAVDVVSDTEWAALKARRKAAKKSKKRMQRLAQESAERANSSGMGESARDSEPDTGRQSMTSEQRILETQQQRHRKRKERHRHKESDQGGPGAISARLFHEDDDEGEDSAQDGPRPPSGTMRVRSSAHRDPAGRLTDLIHVDVNSELPQIDYFRGNANLSPVRSNHQASQSGGGRGPGFGRRGGGGSGGGPGRGGPGSTLYDDLAGGHSQQTADSIVTKSQFPSWH
eukprot:gene26142-32675_t